MIQTCRKLLAKNNTAQKRYTINSINSVQSLWDVKLLKSLTFISQNSTNLPAHDFTIVKLCAEETFETQIFIRLKSDSHRNLHV